MGEIANEIIEGEIYQICLSVIDDITGYPQTYNECESEADENNINAK